MIYDYMTGTPIEFSPIKEPEAICDLCGETCTDDFELEHITASLSIIVCRVCLDQDPVEYDSILGYVKSKITKP